MKIFTFFSLLFCALISNAQQLRLLKFSSGYTRPVGIENCGDSRLFIVDEIGKIFICDSTGKRKANPFLDITDRVLSNDSEQGLLGLAFDPNYANNRFFYVNYINKSGNTQISKFKAKLDSPDLASKNSEQFILQIAQPFSNHNGGCIRFGPDGYLYIGMGDGGSGGDPNNNAQNPQSLLGKMLRIDVSNVATYRIPRTNPFVDSPSYKPEIWDVGMRNPWRWSFDALTGNLHIADVGQDTWEEIDVEAAGDGGNNYGWRCYEADHAYNTDGCKAQSVYKFPVYEYQHGGNGGDCSITGGFVYRGSRYGALYGKYIFVDYCTGVFRLLYKKSGVQQLKIVLDGDDYSYTSFGEDKNHELFVCNLSTGNIYRVSYGTATLNDNIAANNLQNNLSISPNPARGLVNIAYTSLKTERVSVHITNLLGKEVYTVSRNINAGMNSFKINLNVPNGNYYLSVINAAGNIVTQSLRVE